MNNFRQIWRKFLKVQKSPRNHRRVKMTRRLATIRSESFSMSGSPCPKCRDGKLRRETSRMVGNSRVAYLGCNRCAYNHGAVAVTECKRPRGSVLNARNRT